MNQPIHQKKKDRPRKQRIKSMLRRIAIEESTRLFPLILSILDILDDGNINGTILGGYID